MRLKSRFYWFGIGAALAVMLVGVAVYLCLPKTMSVDAVLLSNCEVTENAITIQGGFVDSASKYRGYKLSYNAGVLSIQMRGSLLTLSGSEGAFDLDIPNRYEEIREIHIQGADTSDRVLVWPKTS